MGRFDKLKTTPLGSVISRPEEESSLMLKQVPDLPDALKEFISGEKTGAIIRGLAKSYELPIEKSWAIAWRVLQIVVGEKKTTELRQMIMDDTGLPSEQAEKAAKEIENDLLAPLRGELEKYWASGGSGKQDEEAPREDEKGIGNVVDLRKNNSVSPPKPPEIPKG